MAPPSDAELIAAAKATMDKAYAPYSRFLVSAALLTDSGEVVTGVNIENASYGLTICAERTAIFKAVSEGARKVEAIAIVSSGGGPTWPCGGCRQVLHEFGPDMRVIIEGRQGLLIQRTLGQLLPNAFGSSDIVN